MRSKRAIEGMALSQLTFDALFEEAMQVIRKRADPREPAKPVKHEEAYQRLRSLFRSSY